MKAFSLKSWPGAELLYPRQCIECNGEADPGYDYLCWNCASRINFMKAPLCRVCGNTVEGRVDAAFVCHHCRHTPRQFDLARSVARYDGVLRNLVHTYKYSQGIWLVRDLVRLLEVGWKSHFFLEEIDGVVWVPLHPTRQRSRGFNQACLLAVRLSQRVGLPIIRGVIRRDRATQSQTRLTARQRTINVLKAFSCPRLDRVEGKRLLLVDDVMTTGATVNEVARCLRAAGTSAVHVLTVARG